jgi:hypothetical protein
MSSLKNLVLAREKATGARDPILRRTVNNIILHGGEGETKRLTNDLTFHYTDNDYNSRDGMQTATWGPLAWGYLHISSCNFPIRPNRKDPEYESKITQFEERVEAYKTLLDGVQGTLPCGHCRTNFTVNKQTALGNMKAYDEPTDIHGKSKEFRIESEDDIFSSRKMYSRFIWELHHVVNEMLGKNCKKEESFFKMRDKIETFRSRCQTKVATGKKEGGCTAAVHGADTKARCEIKWVPRDKHCLESVGELNIAAQCYPST